MPMEEAAEEGSSPAHGLQGAVFRLLGMLRFCAEYLADTICCITSAPSRDPEAIMQTCEAAHSVFSFNSRIHCKVGIMIGIMIDIIIGTIVG